MHKKKKIQLIRGTNRSDTKYTMINLKKSNTTVLNQLLKIKEVDQTTFEYNNGLHLN